MRDQSLNGGLAGVAAKEASHFAEWHTSQMHVLCPLGVIDIPVTADNLKGEPAKLQEGGWPSLGSHFTYVSTFASKTETCVGGTAGGGGQKYKICYRFYISVALFSKNRPIYDCRFFTYLIFVMIIMCHICICCFYR